MKLDYIYAGLKNLLSGKDYFSFLLTKLLPTIKNAVNFTKEDDYDNIILLFTYNENLNVSVSHTTVFIKQQILAL